MRLTSLDSLRGVAALVVVFCHSVLTLPGGGEQLHDWLGQSFSSPWKAVLLMPVRLLLGGPAAVLVFFVLSGLVLAITFVRKDEVQYAPFLIKRLTRIWPPFAVAILVSACLASLFPAGDLTEASAWFNTTWRDPIDASLIAQHLAMTGTAIGLDNPMWSLVHEMRISILFPLLVAVTAWNWRVTLGASILLAAVSVKLIGLELVAAGSFVASLVGTLLYVFMFVAGIILAMFMDQLRRAGNRLPRVALVVLWIAALAGLSYAPGRTDQIIMLRDAALLVVSGGAAATLVLPCTLEGRVHQFLAGPVPTYLGRISYSLYLVHVIVSVAVLRLLHGLAPTAALLILSLFCSIALADLCQRYIEVPATDFGRRPAERFTKTKNAAGLV